MYIHTFHTEGRQNVTLTRYPLVDRQVYLAALIRFCLLSS